MSIDEIIKRRGITDILHFTTNQGLTGILASRVVKPRQRLSDDKLLEYICVYNCPNRNRDTEWHDYVNLSITTVNMHLFGISKAKWHSGSDNWWCVLSFSPDIITHQGVYFTTTNNIYTGVIRGQCPEGLENIFADKILRWQGNIVKRGASTPKNQPTCNQAEILYPAELSIDYLQYIYVEDSDTACSVESILDVFSNLPRISVMIKSELFS